MIKMALFIRIISFFSISNYSNQLIFNEFHTNKQFRISLCLDDIDNVIENLEIIKKRIKKG